jgi:hypothetical protein
MTNATPPPAATSPLAAPTSAIDLVWRCEQVTVYEDRADVVRVADVVLPAGACALRFAAVSPLVDEARLTARVENDGGKLHEGARVDDARVQRRSVAADADDEQARRRLRELDHERLEGERRVAEDEFKLCEATRAHVVAALTTAARGAARRLGRGGSLDDIDAELGGLGERVRAAHEAVAAARGAVERIAAAQRGLAAPLASSTTKRTSDVVVRVSSAEGGPARVVLSTVVPCAAWRPTHEARLTSATPGPTAGSGEVSMRTQASVWNRTGEHWSNARIVLSTARPSLGAEVPTLSEDRLYVRAKTAEERRTIVVEHRTEMVPPSAIRGGAPGVDDGGEARVYSVASASVPDDGRPHQFALGSFAAPASLARVCLPEAKPFVFLRASLRNAGNGPLLAGPVTLVHDGAWVGIGDILYTGVGDELDLSFGSDDRFTVRFQKRTVVDRKLVGRDVVHYVQDATIASTAMTAEEVLVVLRMPVSELAQVQVLPSPHQGTVATVTPDEHGLVRAPARIEPGRDRVVSIAFTFETTGEVRIPPPW